MNNFAVSSDGIAIALQDSASALMEAGNNLEQSVALVAAANKVVQDPNSVGSALRTISLRLRGTSVEVLEEMGEETDGVVESVSKMQEKIEALTGVNILTDSGAYKETYQILYEIGQVWKNMNDIDQAALLELMAGKNRANTLAAILGNMGDLEGAYESALKAEGSAMRENQAYLDSIQGRIDLFNNSVQTMWMNFIDSDVVKFIVDIGTGLIKLVDNVGLLKIAIAGLLTYLNLSSKSNFDLASMLGIHKKSDNFLDGFSIFGEKIKGFKEKIKDLKKQLEESHEAKEKADGSKKEKADKPKKTKANKSEKKIKDLEKQLKEAREAKETAEDWLMFDEAEKQDKRIKSLEDKLRKLQSVDITPTIDVSEIDAQIDSVTTKLADARNKLVDTGSGEDSTDIIAGEIDGIDKQIAELKSKRRLISESISDYEIKKHWIDAGFEESAQQKLAELKEIDKQIADLQTQSDAIKIEDAPEVKELDKKIEVLDGKAAYAQFLEEEAPARDKKLVDKYKRESKEAYDKLYEAKRERSSLIAKKGEERFVFDRQISDLQLSKKVRLDNAIKSISPSIVNQLALDAERIESIDKQLIDLQNRKKAIYDTPLIDPDAEEKAIGEQIASLQKTRDDLYKTGDIENHRKAVQIDRQIRELSKKKDGLHSNDSIFGPEAVAELDEIEQKIKSLEVERNNLVKNREPLIYQGLEEKSLEELEEAASFKLNKKNIEEIDKQITDLEARKKEMLSAPATIPADSSPSQFTKEIEEVKALEAELERLQAQKQEILSTSNEVGENTVPIETEVPKYESMLSVLQEIQNIELSLGDEQNAANKIDLMSAAAKNGQESLVAYISSLDDADIALKAYAASVDDGNYSLAGFQKFIAQHNAEIKQSGNAAKAAAVGHQLLNAALSMGVTMLASFAIDLVVKGLDKMITTTEEAAEAAEDAITKYKDMQSELKTMDSTISELTDDYQRLALGVDEFGNNINLTTEEYERYNQIVNQIADMFPEMVRGYTDEGNAIIKNKGNVEALTEAYKTLKAEANNELLNNADNIMSTYKSTIDGSFWSWDNSTSEKISASQLLENVLKEQDSFDFAKFNSEYRDKKYDTILSLLGDAGISREKSENNAEYVKRAVSEFPGIVQSIINSWDSVVDSAVSNVKPLVSAYLDTSIGYESLTDAQKSIFESIASSFDSNFFSQFDGNASKMYQTIENMILNLKSSGIDDEYTLILNTKTQFNNDEVTIGDYKKQVQEFVSQIEELQEQGLLDENSVQYIKMSLGFDLDGNSEYDAYINRAKKILQDDYDDMTSELTLSDLQIIDQLDVPDGTLLTWEQLRQKIAEVKRTLNSDTTSVQTYSELSASIGSYNEILTQTSEIVSDNTEVTQEYKDSLTALGISSTELSECFDENNGLVVKNADMLNKLVKSAKNNIAQNTKLAKTQAKLKYYELYKKMRQLTNGRKVENAATLKQVNAIYQEMSALQKVIAKYTLLEHKLLGATNAYDKLADAQAADEAMDYGSKAEELVNVLAEAFNTAELGTEAAQVAIAGLIPDELIDKTKTLDEQMQQIYSYFTKGTISQLFTIEFDDDGGISSVEMTKKNIEEFTKSLIGSAESGAVFQGTWDEFTLNPAITSLEEFADACGLTEEVAFAFLTSLEKYDISWLGGDYTTLLDQLMGDDFEYQAHKNIEALADLEHQMANGKITAEEYATKYAELSKIQDENNQKIRENATAWANASTEVATAKQKVEELTQEINTMRESGASEAEIQVKTTQLKDASEVLSDALKKKYALQEPTEMTLQIVLDDIQAQIDQWKADNAELVVDVVPKLVQDENGKWTIPADVQATLDESEKAKIQEYLDLANDQYTITVLADANPDDSTAELKEVETAAEAAQQAIENIPDPEISTTSAQTAINTLKDVVGNLINKMYEIPTDVYTTIHQDTIITTTTAGTGGANGTAHANGTAYKSGSWGAKRTETALVGEVGPELLVRGDRWTTIGENGAEFTQVKKGDIIFNHKQTEDLLSKGYVTGRGKLKGGHAFASGTAYAGINTWDDSYDRLHNDYSNGTYDGGDNDSDDDYDDDAEEVVDFIEMKLEEIEAIIEKTSAKIANFLDDTTSIKSKDELYDELIKAEKDKSEAYLKAAQKYNVEAAAALSGVPQQYQEMARNGAIAIEDFIGEDQVEIAEKIQEYRDWAAKADEAENGHLEAIAAISAHRVEQLEDIATDFENIISISQSRSDLLQAEMDFIEESGNRLSESHYEELKTYSQKQLNDMQNERAALQKILDDAVAAGDVIIGSDDWYSMLETINEVDKEIIECKTDLEEFQNAINDLYWDNFDKTIEKLDNINDELSHQYDLISDAENIVDKAGNWTKDGYTSLELLTQQIEIAEQKVKEYDIAINQLKKDYRDGLYSMDEYDEKLAELTDGYYDTIDSIEDTKDAIRDLYQTRFDTTKTGFENIIGISQSHVDLLQSEMGFIEESGNRLSENYYEELKKHSQKQMNDMLAERAALQKILDDAIATGNVTVGSDDWHSMIEAIYKVDQEIVGCKTSLEEFQNAINDLYWDNFDKLIAEIDNVHSELSNLYDLVSDTDDIVDEMGNWTDDGITALGLLTQQMENAQFKSKEYGDAIAKLKKDYADGLYSTDEYNERLADLTESQYDAIKSYEDAKDAIVDLNKTRVDAVKDGIGKEIDAYEELISKKKESLNADKDARDFERSVEESNKSIYDVERKIASLKGNTSSSAIAERRRLEEELRKLQQEREDLFYDESVENQQDALDKELENFQDAKNKEIEDLEEYLKNQEKVLQDSFAIVQENTQQIAGKLIEITEDYGVTISDTVATPWINGTNAIGTYEEQLNTSVSATTKNLETLKQQLKDLENQADKTANSVINSTHSSIATANDGHQTSIKGYAKGSKSVEYDQWALIDELGDELQLVPNKAGRLDYIKKGTGILNNTLTEKLIDLAIDPTSMLENSRPVVGTPGITTTNNNISIDMHIAEVVHIDHADNNSISDVTKAVKTQMDNYMRDINNKLRRK